MKFYYSGILLFLLLFLFSVILLFSIEKGEEIIYLSTFHKHYVLVILIKFITRFGEAFTFIPVILMLFLNNQKKNALYLTLLMISLLLIVPSIKNLFPEMLRPAYFLETNNLSYLKPSWELHYNNSFPSGHTIAATTFFVSLYLLYSHKKYVEALIFVPFLVAFSRVFLFQHYLKDVVVGLLLGFLFSFFSFILFLYFEKRNNE